ncbi:hypothetical protein WDU94_012033 [Cyamophila willieti]
MISKTLQYMMRCVDNTTGVYLSYLQLYSEKCYDLLNSNKEVSLKNWTFDLIHPDERCGFEPQPWENKSSYLQSEACGHELVKYSSEMTNLNLHLSPAVPFQVTAVTKMNATSSRSHSICTISDNVLSKLHLVDLAGSEQFFSLNDDYLLRNEARKINLSLHYLEQVNNLLSSYY